MPLRSLLLTFDQLTPETLTTTSGSVTLSQHYLRAAGAASIMGPTTASGTASIAAPATATAADAAEQRQKFRLVTIANETVDGETCLKHLQPEICDFDNAFPFLERELNSPNSSTRTLWIHVQNGASFCPDDVSRFLQLVRSNRSSDSLLAISAFRQPHQEVDHPFEILVHESLLQVPATLEHSAFPTFHSQTITSSSDLMPTLLTHADRSPEQSILTPLITPSQPKHSPQDLTQITLHPGRQWPRSLPMELGQIRALREANFLYAAQVDSTPESTVVQREGLFVKPQDLWNVHNVSSEYLETTDTMRQQLGLN